jgi:hypothetical protein
LTIVVLLFLAGIWATVLLPPAFRARAEGRPADSIGSFRRQLHVLDRLGPTTVTPAHRLLGQHQATGPAAIGLGLGYANNLNRGVVNGVYRRPSRAALARKRRRDIFQGLLLAMVGSLGLGFLPALRVMWGLHLVLDALFVAYVALLLRMRNLASEREMKVRFLPTAGMGRPEPALALRRSAN